MAAACPDGTGSAIYEDWMGRSDMTSHEAVIARFSREGYAIGPHKAFQISRDASRFRVALHSEMPARLVERLLLTPVSDFDRAVADAVDGLAPGSRIGIMPRANATIAVVGQDSD
jgi:nickel-dependent lactate racemase